MDPKEYEILSTIGRGTCSKVYKALCKQNNQIISIKIINLEEYPLSLEVIQKQTAFWSCSKHPNILKYYGSFVVGSNIWILSEYMACGSLHDILRFGYGSGIKDEKIVSYIAQQICNALCYFHQNREIHRDIRSGNILVNSRGEIKLSDFGLATSLIQRGKERSAAISMYGEVCYMAPEILKQNEGYTHKTDIWSLGLVLIEIVSGKMPYDGMKFMESMVQIISKDPPKLPKEGHSSALVDFVDQCLKIDPSKRASAEELMEHKFLKLSTGPSPLITTIISQLAPQEQRYAMLYGSLDEEENAAKHDRETFEFTFNEPKTQTQTQEKKDNNKAEEKIVKEEAKDAKKEEANKVEEVKIVKEAQNTPANEEKPENKEPAKESPQPERQIKKIGRFSIHREQSSSPGVDTMRRDIRKLHFEILHVERESQRIKNKVNELSDLIHQYAEKHQNPQ